mmetsp:Transcript_17913/g.49675  ORF Transcript_17913/g.49675 Transcript_17913/m.49675 type:complete len:331 (-) Transcript_17913:73-1065(-)|eukprot:CAMPEP_0198135636 /NCGR_PEP_ID=MMETSP1442-20131203/60692_1 /TAXON_ID= /ORGANISM="Craspedostauros australis, Strain CCMP3328" /LENGTH=330 /DNA_ID=CAMNT_0043796809 /DNA_START=45 /DNA_END=1037 /DNA_ORIENTATION=-
MKIGTDNLAQSIWRLLLRSQIQPLVEVKPSTKMSAGKGVFIRRANDPNIGDISSADENTVKAGTALCLYPGIYTPGLPNFVGVASGIDPSILYFANQRDACGMPMDANAYILNTSHLGGYIDASKGSLNQVQSGDWGTNPAACGHLVNHSALDFNVSVVSFRWNSVSVQDHARKLNANVSAFTRRNADLRQEEGVGCDSADRIIQDRSWLDFHSGAADENGGHSKLTQYYPIPNSIRCDGSAWYMDDVEGRMIMFPKHDHMNTDDRDGHDGQVEHDGSDGLDAICKFERSHLVGAAMIATKDMKAGDELFLDYGLDTTKPLPPWASGWYE